MKRWIKFFISATFLILAFYLLDWGQLKKIVFKINPTIFVFAILLIMVHFIPIFLRWYSLIFKTAPISFTQHMRYFFLGIFFNTFTVANIGGDVYRVVYLKPHAVSALPVIIALFRERFCGLLACFLLYLFCLGGLFAVRPTAIFQFDNIFMFAGWIIMLAMLVIFWSSFIFRFLRNMVFFCSRDRLISIVNNLCDAVRFESWTTFLKLMGFSWVALIIWISTVRMIAIDLDVDISFLQIAVIVILVELIRLVPAI